MRRILTTTLTALAVLVSLFALPLALPAPSAQAHVERPSYWPDPKPDCSISPCAGGAVPKARSLASAVRTKPVGRTRVVCQQDSMKRLRKAVTKARAKGYDIRPTVHKSLGAKKAKRLLEVNRRLFELCSYRHIQAAVTASGNNDRVVVMPGLYKEAPSRAMPTNDPACDKWHAEGEDGDPAALSHDYQIHCPNDANLVAAIGRGPDTEPAPSPPSDERHGIPGVGDCIRCNFQLEGSGVSADDVIIEAGSAKAGNGGPSAAGHKKDVGIFVDRADGFVLRNVNVRHAREHDIYVLETDGYLLDRFKVYYAGGYGVLTFVGDHGMIQNCDAAGHGDSGLYPGSGADSTDDRYLEFYPKWRYSQTVRKCDSHHNASGFSGTNSHGTLITRNNFYDNALGFTTDVFTAPGHPGFPQHGNTISHNNFYDNWRRGAMLFAVPDATVCGPEPVGSDTPVPGCNPARTTTSFGNDFHGNTMGVTPSGKVKPNGTDFWWDNFPGNTGNCWWDNTGADGGDVTTSPALLPSCADGTQPALSVGFGDVVNEGELAACLAGYTVSGYPNGNSDLCDWTQTPAKPGSGAQATSDAASDADQVAFLGATCGAGLSPRLCGFVASLQSNVTAGLFGFPFVDRDLPTTALSRVNASTPLGSVTCSWWRQADEGQRLGMVQRIRAMATAPINGTTGDATTFGNGAGLSDTRAMKLFEGRCSTFGAGPFALYKIYGAAAPFAAFTG